MTPFAMPISAQTRTMPPATAPQSATTQQADAQSATLPPTPAFDVASIHPNNSVHTARTHIYSYANQGHFIAINATPMQLLQYAYNLPGSRILGLSGWATSAKYDIEAKSGQALVDRLAVLPYPDAKDQLLKMVQLLLADRFHLAAHRESRELPVYELVVAKGGVKFSPVKDGPKHVVDSNSRAGNVSMSITSSSHAMNDLAEMLYRYTGRVVFDRTGLTGIYTISLTFTPDDSRSAVPDTETTSSVDASPSIFTALKEQLGLELKSSKGPVDVLVVDHIDPPTEN
ncbi:MAG TPA: TIGR03435 family protein [Terracidiphilus sp.]|nr:TIGR03435 family protein [Terracidiphilus sp.]